MTQSRRILWPALLVATLLLLPLRASAQTGTLTDDGFVSANSGIQQLNLNGQGISLIIAGKN